uniref:EF-hand domain-containing protein n=1 Tax=Oryctolagus cuniculus TaxID=9986 RepID=G1U0I4_RABIT
MQIPLTSSGAVPYPEFLSKFGRIDLNVSVTKRGGGTEPQCCRTLKELETQIGEKVFRNIKAVIKAFRLIDVNRTGLVQPQELRRVLEAFCLNMSDGEYAKFSRHYGLDRDAPVDYSGFLKNLSINSDLNLRYIMQNPELAGGGAAGQGPPRPEQRRGSGTPRGRLERLLLRGHREDLLPKSFPSPMRRSRRPSARGTPRKAASCL